ncbi:hypothetical protein AYL99_07048 [Fonsecaea erecta]|uniref:Uncharacterized protein n=1 Tax=Fonsecaea erecta TaxID=1367422 RepID=A0A178ZDW7_9EURO|nr:hypothetical protein AYL99_07048 [Fonsecaea erecta]OAP57958.1 hypothetical protein AYL99_07048 [Fonsecaea erecta]
MVVKTQLNLKPFSLADFAMANREDDILIVLLANAVKVTTSGSLCATLQQRTMPGPDLIEPQRATYIRIMLQRPLLVLGTIPAPTVLPPLPPSLGTIRPATVESGKISTDERSETR